MSTRSEGRISSVCVSATGRDRGTGSYKFEGASECALKWDMVFLKRVKNLSIGIRLMCDSNIGPVLKIS